jgi:hypothetical protein
MKPAVIRICAIVSLFLVAVGVAPAQPASQERMVEWTIESRKTYADPFNDVDVDVVFSNDGQSWRVPAFWRGGERWTVRFAPPAPGEYSYRLQSTDVNNSDLNGHPGKVTVTSYQGSNELLRHGMLRVSANKRYFEHADGTPFYWLGDTWWTGLSDRLSWEGFQKLTDDRNAKGFTVVQIVAGLVPPEEFGPMDAGFHNEGGQVWTSDFKRINPQYFDYADRRIQYLLDHGIVPAIVGAWTPMMDQIGLAKMKQHWRYIIARYGAYPTFWLVGGSTQDPPDEVRRQYPEAIQAALTRGWTDLVRYVRTTDPYHHPTSVHEDSPPFDTPLQDESLMDFDLFQSGHYGWPTIGVAVSQLNQHYSRTAVTKPEVMGEIGYETLGGTHFEDFQRTAFWLSMLNGAAGHTYGVNGVFEAYTGDKPLHRMRWSFLSWEEGMNLPGSYQVGLGAKLLRQYAWWRFAPHPEWVTPHGTTLLEPHAQINGFAYGSYMPCDDCDPNDRMAELESSYVSAEWKARGGIFRLPYAAGIPGEVRIVYVPAIGLFAPTPPTLMALEPGIRYHAFWWEPAGGTKVDLGAVERPAPAPILFDGASTGQRSVDWEEYRLNTTVSKSAPPATNGETLAVLKAVSEKNSVASVDAKSNALAELVLRFHDPDNFLFAEYSPVEKALYLTERQHGVNGHRLGKTSVSGIGVNIRITVEARDSYAAASMTDGTVTYTTPIVDLAAPVASGSAGLLHHGSATDQTYANFQLRGSPTLVKDENLQRVLYDAKGGRRGELVGSDMTIGTFTVPGWSGFARDKHILLDSYRPERLPTSGDWILVLEAQSTSVTRK